MPATRRAVTGNLPAEVKSFVGRRREIDEVKRLLSRNRLVTLTGMGGAGKTRLAVRAAAEFRRGLPDGVWFVGLTELHVSDPLVAEVQDPDALAFLLMGTLGLGDRDVRTPLRSLTEQLADRRMLLVLDNCEHVLPASGLLADELLRGCPALRVLATSREPLGIAAESPFALPPLPVPDADSRAGVAELGRCESVALFVTRAQAVVPGFALSEDNRGAVAELCHRLDGLPLAIELAASRVRALAPQQILDWLSDRFALLTRGNRDSPVRQQTMRACLDWSFELCSGPERVLWARLSAFAGTFDLDAVEGVCADEEVPEQDIAALVAGLAHKSILVRADGEGPAGAGDRYRMLETIREYGRDQLRQAGEEAAVRARHRDWYQQMLSRARAEWFSDRQGYWTALLPWERPNLRVAVEFCLTEPGEAEAGLRLAVTLPPLYWRASGWFGEGRRWLERALAEVRAPTALRARGLLVTSRLAFSQGDVATAMRLLDEGEDLARRLGAEAEVTYAALIRAMGMLYEGDGSRALEILDPVWRGLSRAPDPDPHMCMNVLSILCMAAALVGRHELAGAYEREMIAIVEPVGEGHQRSIALWSGGLAAWYEGDHHQAAAQLTRSLRDLDACAPHDRYLPAQCIEVLAWVDAAQSRHRRAAVLLGAAAALWADVGTSITSFRYLTNHHDACERRLRAALGDAAFTEAVDHGRTLPYDDVIAYALEEPRERTPPPHRDTPTPLTRRQQEIADLIARGLMNKEIAATLSISKRTVDSHVERILTTLGFDSRAQVAAWVAERVESVP
jgi:predicted ATPase/DNA-binding NarL/FixJ family response regulator